MALSGKLPNIRAQYKAGDGNVLVHGDWSQQELRLRGHITGDEQLVLDIATGDVYRANAQVWFRLPESAKKLSNKEFKAKDHYFEQRQCSKTIHLASQYSAGLGAVFSQALATDRKFPWLLVKQLYETFRRHYWRTVEWWHEEQERVGKVGYSESRILFRRRVYPRPPPITEVANYPCQATGSDMTNLCLIELDGKLPRGAYIIAQCYDAIDVECRAEMAQDVAKLMKKVMEQTFVIEGRNFQCPVEIKIGEWWSDV